MKEDTAKHPIISSRSAAATFAVITAFFWVIAFSGVAPAGLGMSALDLARADVIDEYEEPPPPVPEPQPEPPTAGGKPSPSGNSGSQSGSSGVSSYDSGYVEPSAATSSDGNAKPSKAKPAVAPDPAEKAAIELEPPSTDSSFLSAAFGGVGWLLPGLMIAIAIAAAVWMRVGRPDMGSPRATRSGS